MDIKILSVILKIFVKVYSKLINITRGLCNIYSTTAKPNTQAKPNIILENQKSFYGKERKIFCLLSKINITNG